MTLGREERLAVLRMVALGKVAPEQGLDLLDALSTETESEPEQGTALSPDQILLVRFRDPPQQMDFTLRAAPIRTIAAVIRDVLAMLPEDAGELVPPGLLRGLESITVSEAPDDTLVRIEDAPQELIVQRVRAEGGQGPLGAAVGMHVRQGGDGDGQRAEFRS